MEIIFIFIGTAVSFCFFKIFDFLVYQEPKETIQILINPHNWLDHDLTIEKGLYSGNRYYYVSGWRVSEKYYSRKFSEVSERIFSST